MSHIEKGHRETYEDSRPYREWTTPHFCVSFVPEVPLDDHAAPAGQPLTNQYLSQNRTAQVSPRPTIASEPIRGDARGGLDSHHCQRAVATCSYVTQDSPARDL